MEDKEKVLLALDTLAVALVDHDHNWSSEERSLYEEAVKALS